MSTLSKKNNLFQLSFLTKQAGYVSEHSAYHHGETSLQSTIVGLAQVRETERERVFFLIWKRGEDDDGVSFSHTLFDPTGQRPKKSKKTQNFVGSNNINLLVPQGQFGTRLMGGKDAASARYIYTRLDPMARALFHEADDALLEYLNEEGQVIEPRWYVPLIPTVLVNGAEGIGTGWSTFVPNYNPRDLVAGVRALLRGDEPQPLSPWYRGFAGKCEEVPSKTSGKSYSLSGLVEVDEEARTVDVVELPVRKWTQDYKEFLETLVREIFFFFFFEESSLSERKERERKEREKKKLNLFPKKKSTFSSSSSKQVKPPEGSGPNARPVLADYREHHTDSTVHFALQAPEGDDRAWNDLTGEIFFFAFSFFSFFGIVEKKQHHKTHLFSFSLSSLTIPKKTP